MALEKISELKEGYVFQLRGGKKPYQFIAFIGTTPQQKGIAFMKDANGKEWHRKLFPFTKVFHYPEAKTF